MVRRETFVGLFGGVVFGLGLAVSGMTDPLRVRGFLDLAGAFDPTLAFVMIGALAVMALAWVWQARLPKPFVASAFDLPARQSPVTGSLILGAILFGLGWGVAGLCPGPALADLALAPGSAAVFLIAMAVGMAGHRVLRPLAPPGRAAAAPEDERE